MVNDYHRPHLAVAVLHELQLARGDCVDDGDGIGDRRLPDLGDRRSGHLLNCFREDGHVVEDGDLLGDGVGLFDKAFGAEFPLLLVKLSLFAPGVSCQLFLNLALGFDLCAVEGFEFGLADVGNTFRLLQGFFLAGKDGRPDAVDGILDGLPQ